MSGENQGPMSLDEYMEQLYPSHPARDDYDQLKNERDGAKAQIDALANFIMAEVPGEPSGNMCAVESAISIIRRLQKENKILMSGEKLKNLEHFKQSVVGLWATDKSEKIPEKIKEMFFEIKS